MIMKMAHEKVTKLGDRSIKNTQPEQREKKWKNLNRESLRNLKAIIKHQTFGVTE